MKKQNILFPILGIAIMTSFYGCSKNEENKNNEGSENRNVVEAAAIDPAQEYEADLKLNGVIIPKSIKNMDENKFPEKFIPLTDYSLKCSLKSFQTLGAFVYVSTQEPLKTYVMEYTTDHLQGKNKEGCPNGTKFIMTKETIDLIKNAHQKEQKALAALSTIKRTFSQTEPNTQVSKKSSKGKMVTDITHAFTSSFVEILGQKVLVDAYGLIKINAPRKQCKIGAAGKLYTMAVLSEIENGDAVKELLQYSPNETVGIFKLKYTAGVAPTKEEINNKDNRICYDGAIVLQVIAQ